MNNLYPVYTLTNECHDCYKCVRHCPVKAIKIEDGHASVIPEKCIACGLCVKVCPQNAKKVRNDLEKVKILLDGDKKVFVSLAPSWVSVLGSSKEKIVAALKTLGFFGVSETAIGAQEVSLEVANILNESSENLHISSACPAVVDYIRIYAPEYVNCLTKILSPALAHAKYLKALYGEDISIVFIGPCAAKKKESDNHPELIDVALTFSELDYWFEKESLVLEKISNRDAEFLPHDAFEGSFYPIEGGMNETIKRSGICEASLINISSVGLLRDSLSGLDLKNMKEKIFIEALACVGGCVNGPCIAGKKAGISSIYDVLSYAKTRDEIPTASLLKIKEDYEAVSDAVDNKVFSVEEIMEKMKSIGKYSIEDELNCGGCGYDTCRNFVQALLLKKAESSMCTSYMRKIAMKKAGAMLRCMPSGVVIVDRNYKIIEANESFVKMFASELFEVFEERPEGIAGAAIEKILPCSDLFRVVLKSGKDVKKEHYSINGNLYNITAFVIEEEQIVGAVFTDVTQEEIKRDEIAKKAHEVITKNIATVQEIAFLLGEHMVDTELILSSIAEGYESNHLEGSK